MVYSSVNTKDYKYRLQVLQAGDDSKNNLNWNACKNFSQYSIKSNNKFYDLYFFKDGFNPVVWETRAQQFQN